MVSVVSFAIGAVIAWLIAAGPCESVLDFNNAVTQFLTCHLAYSPPSQDGIRVP